MSFKVLNTFEEKEHEGIVYEKDDNYPKGKHKADAKRVEFLQKKHPKYGMAFLETPREVNSVNKTEAAKPADIKKAADKKKSDAK